MATYTTGTAVGPGAGAAFFDALHAHMLANGWTDYDVISSVSGSKDIVMQGAALDAGGFYKPIVRITQTSTTFVAFRAYMDWDTTAHAGINEASTTSGTNGGVTVQDASFVYWIRANGLSFYVVAKVGANYSKGYAGMLRRGLPSKFAGITKSTGALAIGATTIATASDMTGKLAVGQKVMVFNYAHSNASANKGNAELVTISAVTGGGSPSLTVSATTKAYDSGAIIGERVASLLGCANVTTTTFVALTSVVDPNGGWTSNVAQLFSAFTTVVLGVAANSDPTDDSGRYGSGYVVAQVNSAGKTGATGSLYHLLVATTAGQSAAEDIFDDGTYTWIAHSASGNVSLMGPREV